MKIFVYCKEKKVTFLSISVPVLVITLSYQSDTYLTRVQFN